MDLSERFARVEETLLSQFREAGFVQHQGDKGENREEILRIAPTVHDDDSVV